MTLAEKLKEAQEAFDKRPGLGTVWVAPGEGSTWEELALAFEDTTYAIHELENIRSNLKLTGAPITPYDRRRWESGNVE